MLGRVASSTILGVVRYYRTVYIIAPTYRKGMILYKAGPRSEAPE